MHFIIANFKFEKAYLVNTLMNLYNMSYIFYRIYLQIKYQSKKLNAFHLIKNLYYKKQIKY